MELGVDFDPTAETDYLDLPAEQASLDEILHRLSRLLPDGQELEWLGADDSVFEALTKLQRSRYSQAPVRGAAGYVGAFSYRSFAKAVALVGRGRSAEGLTVGDCLEDLPFADAHKTLEDVFTDLDAYDAVLLGGRDELVGIVTVMDALRYLYELANAYVLMQQIELGLRHGIRICVDDSALAECVDQAIAQKYRETSREVPTQLGDLELSDLQAMITSRRTKDRFIRVFGHNVDVVKAWLAPLPALRNDLFHFRRPLSVDDYERLAATRDWLLKRLELAEAPAGGAR
jgi:CBS domain-containing protein